MKAAKCILAGLMLLVLAGCVDNEDGRGFHFGPGELYDQGRGPDSDALHTRGGQQPRPRRF